MANKTPQIVREVKKYKVPEVNHALQKTISFSQIQTYYQCPKKWALQYKDKCGITDYSIHMTFGTAIHESIQHYLTVLYEGSISAADRIDLNAYFKSRLSENYLKDYKSNKKIHFSNPAEISEFYEDGVAILDFFKKKKRAYFNKKNWHLVGCEVPLVISPLPRLPNVIYKGYIDIVLYNENSNKFYIYDIKTSTNSWGDKHKRDKVKTSQLLFYKKFFSQQYNIPIEHIDIEFFIVKRKIWENSEFPQSRIQTFKPSDGKNSMNYSSRLIENFVEDCFDSEGKHKDISHSPQPSDYCKWCPFNDKPNLCNKQSIL